MSIAGIASNILTSIISQQSQQSQPGGTSPFQKIQSEFQQLGSDLQSGNLSQAQSDFATLKQNLPANSPLTSASTTASSNSVSQQFSQLATDLQSGNLQGAQQDFATLQQDLQQAVSQSGGHHHHHHIESAQDSSSSQQTNPIAQAFSSLAQTLQSGNLQGAQTAYSSLQSDLQQISGFFPAGLSGSAVSAATLSPGSLNVTV